MKKTLNVVLLLFISITMAVQPIYATEEILGENTYNTEQNNIDTSSAPTEDDSLYDEEN